MTVLTLSHAVRICEGAITKAQDLGIKVAVSVVDSATNLVTMQKMDGTLVLAIEGSRGKAVASAIFGQPSGELDPRADRPVFRAVSPAPFRPRAPPAPTTLDNPLLIRQLARGRAPWEASSSWTTRRT